MSLSHFVAALGWASTFGALWYSRITNEWTAAAWLLILFSFFVALFASALQK